MNNYVSIVILYKSKKIIVLYTFICSCQTWNCSKYDISLLYATCLWRKGSKYISVWILSPLCSGISVVHNGRAISGSRSVSDRASRDDVPARPPFWGTLGLSPRGTTGWQLTPVWQCAALCHCWEPRERAGLPLLGRRDAFIPLLALSLFLFHSLLFSLLSVGCSPRYEHVFMLSSPICCKILFLCFAIMNDISCIYLWFIFYD